MTALATPRPKPITLRRRADLTVTKVDRRSAAARGAGGERRHPAEPNERAAGCEWIIKDPLAMRYFRFAEQEYFLFDRLDGRIDADRLCREYDAAFAPKKLTRPRLAHFLTMVMHTGLVNVDAAGRGRFLDFRRRRRENDERRSRWHGIPSFRFRGIDPTGLLDALLPCGRAAFSRGGLIAFLLLVAAAALAALSHGDQLLRELPLLPVRIRSGGAWLVAVAVVGLKVFHELAHGLACRRFGGECREMGLMWVLCTPLPYCDVSDAWTFRDKRHRIVVAAAGIFAETLAAAIALFCWRYSSPGILHDVALFVGVVALANTLFVNGNPLMRFDGYFALCDALEISNLAERSAHAVRRRLSAVRRQVLGDERSAGGQAGRHQSHGRSEFGYLAYGICSRTYRITVLVGVSVFVVGLGRRYGLGWAAWPLVGWIVATSTGGPISAWKSRLADLWRAPWHRQVRRAALVGLLAAGLFVPMRRSIVGALVVEPATREPAFTSAAGRLREIAVVYGQTIQAGQVIAVLENPDLEADIARLEGELGRQEARLKHLYRARHAASSGGADIRPTEELCDSFRRQVEILRAERSRLRLVARSDGRFISPPPIIAETGSDELANWSGAPLDPANLGASLAPGVLVGEVAATDAWNAVVTVDDVEAARLRVGERANVRLESRAEITWGTIESVTPISQLSLARRPGPALTAAERSTTVKYRVSIRLDSASGLCPGENGEARLDLPNESLFRQAWRSLTQTFGLAS